jgi:hypothetical protein
MKLKDKALKVIEAIVSDDFSADLEMRELHPPVVLSQDDTALVRKKISTIYRISHSIQEDAICYDAHEDWRKEIETLYKKYKKAKII